MCPSCALMHVCFYGCVYVAPYVRSQAADRGEEAGRQAAAGRHPLAGVKG